MIAICFIILVREVANVNTTADKEKAKPIIAKCNKCPATCVCLKVPNLKNPNAGSRGTIKLANPKRSWLPNLLR